MNLCHFQLADSEEHAHSTGNGRNLERCNLDV